VIGRAGVVVKQKQLKKIEPLLHEWTRCVSRYCAVSENDAPYWYNERASLSTLAAAAWKAGGVAVEEYATFKGKKKAGPPDRVDLWFRYRRRRFVVEAKIAWVNLGEGRPIANAVESVRRRLGEALEDVQRCPKDGTFLGVTFVAPSIPNNRKDSRRVAALVGPFLDELRKLDYGFMAWVFPQAARNFIGDDERRYPGVVMLGRIPSHRR
jgi:hypothetical protein